MKIIEKTYHSSLTLALDLMIVVMSSNVGSACSAEVEACAGQSNAIRNQKFLEVNHGKN